MNSKGKLTKAKYIEWQASLFGASMISLGLGVLFANLLKPIALLAIFSGILLHSWGMYKTYQRNRN